MIYFFIYCVQACTNMVMFPRPLSWLCQTSWHLMLCICATLSCITSIGNLTLVIIKRNGSKLYILCYIFDAQNLQPSCSILQHLTSHCYFIYTVQYILNIYFNSYEFNHVHLIPFSNRLETSMHINFKNFPSYVRIALASWGFKSVFNVPFTLVLVVHRNVLKIR